MYDYLRSDVALQRGLFFSKDATVDTIRKELNLLVEEQDVIVRYACDSGVKYRYGITLYPRYAKSEERYLVPCGSIRTCEECGIPYFTCDNKIYHFPAACDRYVRDGYFTVLKYKEDARAIISSDYIYGIIEEKKQSTLQLPKELQHGKAKELVSELWLINQVAREKGYVPKGRVLRLRAKEVTAK
nr:hypothetical protein [Candidatus Sigynarchaeota archaeon]